MVFTRDFSLLAQMFKLLGQFLPNVIHTQQVFARVTQPRFGFLATLTIFRYASRFFEKHAQFFRLGFDNARNHALFNDRVRSRTEAGTEKYIGDIAATHHNIVDVIRRITLPLQHALDGNFAV